MAECNDKRCPVHGSISVRGNVFTGLVVSAKPSKTVVVERAMVKFVPKYERYSKSKGRIYAHSPDCIGAKEDDVVRVGETRRLSKTKSFVVLEIVGKKKIVKVEEDTLGKKANAAEKHAAKAERAEKKGGSEEKGKEKASGEEEATDSGEGE
jgi:small subunit ribosomal protein S17